MGGKIYTVTQGVINDGCIIIEDSKIYKVLQYVDRNSLKDYQLIEAKNKVIIPGLIDAHSHIGLMTLPRVSVNSDISEAVDPIFPNVKVVDAINPKDPSFRQAIRGGVTTVAVRHGSSNLFGGLSAVLKTGYDKLEDMILIDELEVKMAFGMNPKSSYGSRNVFPVTRMGYAFAVRDFLKRTKKYMKEWEKYNKNPEENTKPEKDEKFEILQRLLNKELSAHVHCARADDILLALEISEEFGFDITLGHVYEGYKVGEQIAARNIPAVFGPLLSGWDQGKSQIHNINVAAELVNAGVKVSIMTDSPYISQQDLLFHTTMAVRLGLNKDDALKAITINPAELLGLENRIGSISPGKDADIVILSGEPFDMSTKVEQVIIDGKLKFSIE